MNPTKIIGIPLIAAGCAGLVYGGLAIFVDRNGRPREPRW